VLLTLVLFGTDTWRDFLVAASAAHVDYESGRVKLGAFLSVFGGVRVLGGSAQLGYSLQAAVGVIAAVAVWLVWRHETALPARAASLAAATLVASPFVFFATRHWLQSGCCG
jgi:hypothetical protein